MGRKRIIIGAAIGFGLLGSSAAGAITHGENDDGRHPNVGSIVGEIEGEGRFQRCTGTLIDADVVVTASHCFAGFDDVTFYVTFDEIIDADQDGLVDDGVTLLAGTPHVHPLFGSGGSNNTFDVATFVLDAAVGIDPASLPEAGVLDDRAIRSERFTTVGYGTVRDTKRQAHQAFGVGWRRKMVTQSVNSITKSWITYSMNPSTGNGGTCFGDSGGPHFIGAGSGETDVVAAITVTGDRYCKATDKSYRLDTPSARDFLDDFVTLP